MKIAAFLMIAVFFVATIMTLSQQNERESLFPASDFIVRTDTGTGCQYLETRNGGLIPRIDNLGNHVCVAPGKETYIGPKQP